MAALPYMQLYVADYLADTVHLTAEEHGAYLLLIMNYWQTGKPIPAKRLQAITRIPDERWEAVRENLSEYFNEVDGCWQHNRLDDDLAEVMAAQEQRSKAGKASARARAKNKSPQLNDRSTPVQRPMNDKDTDKDTDKKTSKKETPLPEAKSEMPDKLASVCVAQQQQQEEVCAERVERESTGGRESAGEKELYPDKQSTGDGVQMRLVKSDSSSAREDLPRVRDPAAESFERFWQAFPGRRKSAKGECLKRWRKHRLHAQSEQIMRFVQGMKQGDWAAGKEQFIPAPLVVINQRRWEGWEQPEAAPDAVFAGAL